MTDSKDNPLERWILAHEPDNKEILTCFKRIPSVKVLITPTKLIYRKDIQGIENASYSET